MRCEGEEGVIRAKVYAGSMIKIAVLVVAFSAILVGMASAESMGVSPKNLTILYAPEFATYTVSITGISNTSASHNISATIKGAEPPGTTTDLEFSFSNPTTGASSGWMESGGIWNWGTPSGDSQTLYMHVRAKSTAPQGNGYLLLIEDKGGDLFGATEEAGATTVGYSIPEFTTVAIPLGIALLFAVLFFKRKGAREG